MKISLNWLKDYINLDGISVDEISSRLTMCGLEIDDIVDNRSKFDNFVVGYVKEKHKHTNADKLSVCTVSTGEIDYQVVCGAPNVAAGQKVVFALPGAIIPKNGMTISKVVLRGVESSGMICSEDEIGLSNDHSGIMVLDEKYKVGTPIAAALGFDDVLMEVAITPNRPDALSHLGIARDLAALFEKEIILPNIEFDSIHSGVAQFTEIEVVNEVDCVRYSAKVVVDCHVAESPEWLKSRLKSIGIRAINNVVDVTNYVLFECGQPLHAFDLDKLSGRRIIVKSAEEDEVFTTLDNLERKLNSQMLMICDAEKSVAIAGVMGGENSEVSADTKNILIESAYFKPSSVRKTAKTLGLSTEASYRFERGTDIENTIFAANRAAQLISQLSGGSIADGTYDVYRNKIQRLVINLRFARVTKVLGYTIENTSIEKILKNLGFVILEVADEFLRVEVPLFRADVEREIDLIEEIARIYGYNNIPTVEKINVTLQERVDESYETSEYKEFLIALGFYEVVTNSLISEKWAAFFGRPIPLLNPQSSEMSFLRSSLLPGVLDVVKKNIYAGERNLKLFETGRVFNRITDKEIEDFNDFSEEENLLLVITGESSAKNWVDAGRSYDFYDLKGYLNSLFIDKRLDYLITDNYDESESKVFDYYFSKMVKNEVIGSGGKIKSEVLSLFGIEQDVFCFEISLTKLSKLIKQEKRFVDLLKYPKATRDFAFIFDDSIDYKTIEDFIYSKSSGLLKNIFLFDIYKGEAIGAMKKSMAFSLEFFDEKRTLNDDEIEKEFSILIGAVKNNFKATLRGT